jgi:type IV pilus assembly protein PilQ
MNLRLVLATSVSLAMIQPVIAQQATETSPERDRPTQPSAPRPVGAAPTEPMSTQPMQSEPLNVEPAPAADPAAPAEQEGQAPAPDQPQARPSDDQSWYQLPPTEPDQSVVQVSDSTISVDFPDEEIRTILRIVADLYDLNLVIPESLVGRASIKLRNVTWRQVFDVVLSPAGFTYVEEGGIIKVVSLEALHREPPVTEVTILNYARAEEIVDTIRPLVDSTLGGRIQIDRRSNALVITERPTQMRRIRQIVESLDKATIQVMIESKFIETRDRDLKNVGVNWASLDGYQVSAGPFNRVYENESSRDSTRTRTASNLDVAHMQDGFARAGQIAGEPIGPAFTTDPVTGQRTYTNLGPGSTDTQTRTSGRARLDTAVFSAAQFDVILSALRTTNDIKLVSNPTVVTLNNTQANIHIGQEYPVVTPRYNPQTGTYEAGGAPEITRIGITLDVTPQVNNAGFINLNVEPEVSTLGDTVTYFGAQYPIKVTRRAHSHVTIKDGYTLAIGGLVQDDTTHTERRVPILGSIPGVGRLFRSETTDKDQRNLIIFITARTLNPDGSTFEEVIDPRMVRAMGLTREEIPGYRPQIELFPGDEARRRAEAETRALEGASPLVIPPEAEFVPPPAVEEPRRETNERITPRETAPAPAADSSRFEPREEPSREFNVGDRSVDEEGTLQAIEPGDAIHDQPGATERRRSSRWLTPEM